MEENAMKGIKLYVLDHGYGGADPNWFELGSNFALPGDRNAPRGWKVNCFYSVLIEHPAEGWILIDTGLPAEEEYPGWVLGSMEWHFDEEYSMPAQLAKLGLKPEDIRHVILTHMHMDHMGGARYFKDTATFYVQHREAEAAYTTVMASPDTLRHGFYFKDTVLTPVKEMVYLDGDIELFPGIELISLPGHTPGCMGAVVSLESGDVIIAGDAVSLESNYYGMPSGLLTDTAAAAKSIARVHHLERMRKAKVLFSHDLPRFRELKKAPEHYE